MSLTQNEGKTASLSVCVIFCLKSRDIIQDWTVLLSALFLKLLYGLFLPLFLFLSCLRMSQYKTKNVKCFILLPSYQSNKAEFNIKQLNRCRLLGEIDMVYLFSSLICSSLWLIGFSMCYTFYIAIILCNR